MPPANGQKGQKPSNLNKIQIPSPLGQAPKLKPKSSLAPSNTLTVNNTKNEVSTSNINLSSKKGAPEPVAAVDPVFQQTSKSIADSRANIQALEKAYRESLHFRRLQNNPLTIFNEFSTESTGGSGGSMMNLADLLGGGSVEDIVSKATKELAAVKALKERNAQEKVRETEERERALRESVESTRKFYKEKQECTRAGPQFLFNFFCSFGNIIHVDCLDPSSGNLFIVFSEGGSIEIIEHFPARPTSKPSAPTANKSSENLTENATLSKPINASVAHLLGSSKRISEPPPPEEQSQDTESGPIKIHEVFQLNLIPPGTVSREHGSEETEYKHVTVASTAAGVPQMQKKKQVDAERLAYIKHNNSALKDSSLPVGRITAALKVSESQRTIEVPAENAHPTVGKMAPRAPLIPKSEKFGSLASLAPVDRRINKSVIKKQAQPETITSHGYFIGTSLGEAIMIVIDVSSEKKQATLHIRHRKRTSILPIKTICAAEFQQTIVSVVSHTATSKLVIAQNLELECVWQCKLEFLNGAARDHVDRKVSQTELETFNLQGVEGVTGKEHFLDKAGRSIQVDDRSADMALQLDDFVVSSLCPDKFNKRILVSLKSGSILSISVPFSVAEANSRKQTPPTLSRIPVDLGSAGSLAPTSLAQSQRATPPSRSVSRNVSATNLGLKSLTGTSTSNLDLALESQTASPRNRTSQSDGVPVSRDLFVSWLMDALSIDGLLDTLDAKPNPSPSDPQALFNQSPAQKATPACVPISGLSIFTNETVKADQLMVVCPDGSIRIHSFDAGGAIDSPVPIAFQVSDPESRTMIATVSPSRVQKFDAAATFCRARQDCQFVVSYSHEGILTIFDLDDTTILIDLLIPTNRRIEKITASAALTSNLRMRGASTVAAPIRQTNASIIGPSEAERRFEEKRTQRYGIHVVNADRGLYMLWAGRDWSLFSTQNLITWKMKNIGREQAIGAPANLRSMMDLNNDGSLPQLVIS
ncbi:hypothetical protein BJ741DRAFT_592855 [Chytriomyces cf. hyalinus JEL632]|nr:hypothetical protein BJ741DRAFT_592855 [Chytriomyces cf. hyalinus JEL632]